MEVASPSVRTSRKRRDDAVTAALIHLIVGARWGFREALLDLLYQYRRREGLFDAGPIRIRRRGRPRPTLRNDYRRSKAVKEARNVPLIIRGADPPLLMAAGGPASPTR